MTIDVKAIMEEAAKEVAVRGFSREEAVPVEAAVLTMRDYAELVVQYSDLLFAKEGRNPPQQGVRPKGSHEISLSLENAIRDIKELLGEDGAACVQYLMQVFPEIKIEQAEISGSTITYALKYSLSSPREFFLGTITFDGNALSFWDKRTVVDLAKDNSSTMKRVFTEALDVPELASRYLGPRAKPFPRPI